MATEYDLVVVGAGGAGLAAAVSAAEAGCSVMVLEAEAKIGGSTGHSQGVFTAADTPLQRALGFTDSVEDFFQYYMTLNQWKLPAGVVRKFCENATPTMEWLISLGIEYPVRMARKPEGATWPHAASEPGLYASGVEHPPRGHYPNGSGQAYIDVLDQRRSVLGVEVALNTRVQKLLIESGAVVGVEVEGVELRSHYVAVTCGGFGHDHDLVRKWMPDGWAAAPEGTAPITISAPGSRGDAIRLGEQAGAEITGINRGLMNTRPYFKRRPEMPAYVGTQPTSLIYVNRRGHRFVAETAPYAVMPGLVRDQGHVVWGIFDERARRESDPGEGSWAPQFVLDRVKYGDFKQAGSIAELAKACGLNAVGLQGSVEQYNEAVKTGKDSLFLRKMTHLHEIKEGPFYAFEYRAYDVNLTGAGLKIDTDCHVVDPNGKIIRGLLAAGEAGAGVLGERYVGGGNSVANALTMGRLAGLTVGRELKKALPLSKSA